MKDVLESAIHEIEYLRRRNEVLSAQVAVVEVFRAALLGPPVTQGASADVVWQLRRSLDSLSAKGGD